MEGRECGSRALPCEATALGAVAPRFLTAFHRFCVVAAQALVCPGPACLRHITTYDLESGPWARLPRSFSYHPPPFHGMSRLGVCVCLHVSEMLSALFPGNIGLHFFRISRSFLSNV